MSNIKKIQKWLIKKQIDALIIVRTDEFLSEYIASYAERLKWLSKFSGSAGKAIIMQNSGVIFVDGRYTFQAEEEVDLSVFSIEHLNNFNNWLKKNIKNKIYIKI